MTTKEEEQYREDRSRRISDEWQRYGWILEQEQVYHADKHNANPTTRQYYAEARHCYVQECYLASAFMATSGIEIHLKTNLYGIPPREEIVSFYQMVEEALAEDHISQDLANRLKRLWDATRNPIAHPYDSFTVGRHTLGLHQHREGRKRFSRWGDAKGPHSMSNQQAAEEALKCLLAVNIEWRFTIKSSR